MNIDTANPGETTITPADQTPPSITFIQPATTTYTHDTMLPISVTFSDGTGVASSSVSFDNMATAASSTIDLFFQPLGSHTITASSTDFVNNATTSVKTIQVVATATSAINDVNRAFTLAWIKSKDAKNVLVASLTAAAKLKKQNDRIVAYKVMLVALQVAKGAGVLTLQGYQLLAADIGWLISH